MVAALALRPGKAIAAVVAALFIVGFIISTQIVETPIAIRLPKLRLPDVSVPSVVGGKPAAPNPGNTAVDPQQAARVAETIAAASNSTLGFSKILYVNLQQRRDKTDAALIQAYASGLDIENFRAVDAKLDIEDQNRTGLPPTDGQFGVLGAGAIACWRSHANIWNEMVRTRSPPVLIIEADASWDVNLRPIMGEANQHFLEFLTSTKAKPADSPPYANQALPNRPKNRPVEYDPEDPWQSEFWDIISIGHCHVGGGHKDQTAYVDKYYAAPAVKTEHDIPEGKSRAIRRNEGIVCTTSYAVSHRGAAKMLHYHIQNLNMPVDVIMNQMIIHDMLVSYNLDPPPIVQWAYRDGLGHGGSSDIHPDGPKEENPDRSGFEQAHKDHSIWSPSKFQGVTLNKPALEAWATIFSPEAQFSMPDAGPMS